MTEKKRPTGKNILDGIVQALYDAQEPLDEHLALVPAHYEVYVHPEAYRELQPLMPRIREQVRKKLDAELARLNSRGAGKQGLLKRLFFPVTRLLFADRYFQQEVRPTVFERSSDPWHIDFAVTAEPEAEIDYLVVASDFGTQQQGAYKGRPTINIRRTTRMLPDGRFETVVSARRPARALERKRTPAPQAAGRPAPAADVLACLSYEDRQGRHRYYMKKDQIIIGRQDDPAHYLDVALDAQPDVSREHLRVRYDVRSGGFFVKDVSQYGVTVDGVKVPSSLNQAQEDVNVWHPLPPVAEIGLADVVFIRFEAL